MEDTKDTSTTATPGTQITAEQAGEVAGGDGSSGCVVIGGQSLPGNSVGEALINAYDGAVDAASHVIETVAKAMKQ